LKRSKEKEMKISRTEVNRQRGKNFILSKEEVRKAVLSYISAETGEQFPSSEEIETEIQTIEDGDAMAPGVFENRHPRVDTLSIWIVGVTQV
jgi:hypothetical protein